MARYMKKPVLVEAVQWHKMGDHEHVKAYDSWVSPCDTVCKNCGCTSKYHGQIGCMRVCPSNWVVTTDRDVKVMDDFDFRAQYEPVERGQEETNG